ncbi:hypothetical protein BD779DRAFT_457556 [Infundibulicybe gibba]|nr:hypothetical protein BD779DRAFT_457556 [Infundibulicybe gibba]
MIERSHSAPLSLLGGHKIKWNEALMNLAANNMHRFKSIDLCRAGHNTKSLFKIFSKSTPMLEHLTLASDYYAERAVVIPAFPQEFLGGCAPNLRHVKLSTSAHTPWDSGLFTNLTTLEVSGGRGYDASLSSLEMLLVALTRMPGLEILILRESIPPCAGPTTRRIHANLPSLERMELRDSLDSCTNLLRQVIINTSTTLLLNLSYNITREEVDGFGEVFPPCPWATSTPAKALEWKTRDFKIGAWSAQRGSEVTGSENTWTPLAMVWAPFITLVSPQLRSSRIPNIAGWDVDCWRGFAHVAPELQSLTVGCAVQVVELCKALRPPNRPNLVPEDCCFPALSHLELAAYYAHAMSTPGGGEAQLSTVLARILAERAQIGCSTPELVFNFRPWSEKFPDGWSEPFREAVPGITVREHRGPTMVSVIPVAQFLSANHPLHGILQSTPDLLFLLRSN